MLRSLLNLLWFRVSACLDLSLAPSEVLSVPLLAAAVLPTTVGKEENGLLDRRYDSFQGVGEEKTNPCMQLLGSAEPSFKLEGLPYPRARWPIVH